MVDRVVFQGSVKTVKATAKQDDEGQPFILTAVGLESLVISEEQTKKLIELQRQGPIRFTLEALQGSLPLKGKTSEPGSDQRH